MHNFHYNFVKKHVDAELLFTDTDSLTYETKSEDVYEDFLKPKHLFDLSNYPKDSKFYYAVNEGVIVKMKDQHKGKPITKLIWLKWKMYCIISDDDTEANTAKCVNIWIEFNEYKDVLFFWKNNQTQNEKNSKVKKKKIELVLFKGLIKHFKHFKHLKD